MAVLNFDIQNVSIPGADDAKSVSLSGSIDASTNQLFESQLTDILSSGTNKVLLVLTNVKYINSTGLGTIVKCVDVFREQDGDIKLVGVPTKVIALFEMLGLLALFETYDTMDEAVASFGEGTGGEDAKPQVEFPIQFKHPKTGMGLNVSQPGRFKDPRSGDYFSIGADGTIEFYEITRIKMVDVKLPCDAAFAEGLTSMTKAVIGSCGIDIAAGQMAMEAIQQSWATIVGNTSDPHETCNVLIVGDQEKIQIGILNHGTALNSAGTQGLVDGLKNEGFDDVRNVTLPTRGQLLVLIKRA